MTWVLRTELVLVVFGVVVGFLELSLLVLLVVRLELLVVDAGDVLEEARVAQDLVVWTEEALAEARILTLPLGLLLGGM